MDDLINIKLSKMASDEADRLQSACHFRDAITVARLGMAITLNNCSEEDIISWLDLTEKKDPRFETGGYNYNIGSIDPQKILHNTIMGLFPSCTIPYRYIRVLMNMGILELGKTVNNLDTLKELIGSLNKPQ